MNKLWMSLILAIGLITTNAFAEENNTRELNSDVDYVLTKGLWENGEKYGRYRLVVRKLGWEHTRSFIYLQWIYLDQSNRESVVINSVAITEFNTEDWRNFESAKFRKNRFIIHYSNRGRDTKQKAKLIPGKPGEYKIEIKPEPF